MANPVQPGTFHSGYRLTNGDKLNKDMAIGLRNAQNAITATASGTQATSTVLCKGINNITVVANTADGVLLPPSTAGLLVVVANNGTHSAQVFGSGTDTINAVAYATGVAQAAGTVYEYYCPVQGIWVSNVSENASFGSITVAGNITETTVGSGFIQKASSLGTARAGTFTLNGATNVTVTNTTVAISDFIGISLNTVGGTVGAQPHLVTIQAGTSFVVVGTAGDTSTYNYSMIGVN